MRGGLMVCGTASDAGKSRIVTGLCRLLARRGVGVAPFKAQNMSNHSFVTSDGYEIGRAQGVQALAAGVEPEVAMNPVLLKPTGERTSQVVVLGRPWDVLDAAEYHRRKPELLGLVLDALADLRRRHDVVVCEGAGSPAEVNLLDHDIVNLRIAVHAGLPAVVVGDIDRGGVFASLLGTVALLPDDQRRCVRGFVINKLRGDPALLGSGPAELERRTGVPTLGVLPFIDRLSLDDEDSLGLGRWAAPPEAIGEPLDVAVIALPYASNPTDLDGLAIEPGVHLRLVHHAAALGHPDLVVLPGTKSTVYALDWLRAGRLDAAIAASGATVLGICGGQQLLGSEIVDDVESGRGRVRGLGWLDVSTTFRRDKVVRRRRAVAMGAAFDAYEIHHGITVNGAGVESWVRLDDEHGDEPEGAISADGRVRGTSLHGMFESDELRGRFLAEVATFAGKTFVPGGASFAAARAAQADRLADLLEAHLDLGALDALIERGAP